MQAAQGWLTDGYGEYSAGPVADFASSSRALDTLKDGDSDCSWTHEEDSSSFYVDMRRQLEEFTQVSDQRTTTTSLLSRRQRRFVHALAQTMGLGHASLGAHGKHRRMIVFKDEDYSADMADLLISQQGNGLSVNVLEASGKFSYGRRVKKQKRARSADGRFPQGASMIHNGVPDERSEHDAAAQKSPFGPFAPKRSVHGQNAAQLAIHTRASQKSRRAGATSAVGLTQHSPTTFPLTAETITQSGSSLGLMGHRQESYEAGPELLQDAGSLGMDSGSISKSQVLLACGFQEHDLVGFGLEEENSTVGNAQNMSSLVRKHFVGM